MGEPIKIKFVGKKFTFLVQLPPGYDGLTRMLVVPKSNQLLILHPDFKPIYVDRNTGEITEVFPNG